MVDNPLISIIIPCYNSAAFLAQTIDWLEKQDVSDCEIVLVNDGSQDETLQIMHEYEVKYSNLTLFSQNNSGVSAARNAGIKLAKGEYLYFLDSDDYLTENALHTYKESILQHPDCDILSFGYKMLKLDGSEKQFVNSKYHDSIIKGSDAATLFYTGRIFLNVCSILLKRELVVRNKLFFKTGIKIGEDYDYIREAMLLVKSLYYNHEICFVYKLRKGSATDGHNGYGVDNFKSLLLSFECAEKASILLKPCTINYFKAARYSAHLKAYLKSDYVSEEINMFFLNNRECLFKKMDNGRSKVLLAIYAFRLVPLQILFWAFGKKNKVYD